MGLSLINSVLIDQMNQVSNKLDIQEINEIEKMKKELDEIKSQQKEIIDLLKRK